jgi:Domain of unknown function (DUF4394)/Calx-beta domain
VRALPATLAAIAAFAVLAPAAGAVPLVVATGSTLANVDTDSLNNPSAPIPVTGMQPGETLTGIDQRPSTGQLYGVGSTGRVYRLNPATGAAIGVGGPGAFTLSGTFFGTDFNPLVDRIRQVSNTEQNLRLNPDSGALVESDAALNPPGNVVGAAYSDNFSDAVGTTLFGIDSAAGTLVRQGDVNGSPQSPNAGTLTPIGSGLGLGTNLLETIGFDIGADGATFATISSGMVSRLYGVNRSNGMATNLGTIGTGTTAYRGLAVMSTRIRVATGSVTASEGDTALVTVTRSAPAGKEVFVDHLTTGGTATSGADFAPNFGTLRWGAGESGSKTVAVPIRSNAPAEGDESFTVSLNSLVGLDGPAFGTPKTATVTIAGETKLQISTPAVTTKEGSGATIQVTRTGLTTRPVKVGYATVAGTARTNDYRARSGTLSWAAGDGAAKTIDVPAVDDRRSEGEERFRVVIASPSGAGAKLGTPTSSTVTIAASDKPGLTLAGAKRQRLRTVRRRGVKVVARVGHVCRLDASLRRVGRTRRLGRKRRALAPRRRTVRVKIAKRRDRRRLRVGQRLRVSASCSNVAGKSRTRRRIIKLTR